MRTNSTRNIIHHIIIHHIIQDDIRTMDDHLINECSHRVRRCSSSVCVLTVPNVSQRPTERPN